MNSVPLPLVERAAYHEAGHLVMARELGIRIDCLRMPAAGVQVHASRFASLNELYSLDSGNDREKRLAVQKYVRFLLAGPAAVMLRLEEHHGVNDASLHRTRFRSHWLARALARGDSDLDVAYSLLLAWGSASQENKLEETFQDYWKLAVASFQYPTLWRRVQRFALHLVQVAPVSMEDKQDRV